MYHGTDCTHAELRVSYYALVVLLQVAQFRLPRLCVCVPAMAGLATYIPGSVLD